MGQRFLQILTIDLAFKIEGEIRLQSNFISTAGIQKEAWTIEDCVKDLLGGLPQGVTFFEEVKIYMNKFMDAIQCLYESAKDQQSERDFISLKQLAHYLTLSPPRNLLTGSVEIDQSRVTDQIMNILHESLEHMQGFQGSSIKALPFQGESSLFDFESIREKVHYFKEIVLPKLVVASKIIEGIAFDIDNYFRRNFSQNMYKLAINRATDPICLLSHGLLQLLTYVDTFQGVIQAREEHLSTRNAEREQSLFYFLAHQLYDVSFNLVSQVVAGNLAKQRKYELMINDEWQETLTKKDFRTYCERIEQREDTMTKIMAGVY